MEHRVFSPSPNTFSSTPRRTTNVHLSSSKQSRDVFSLLITMKQQPSRPNFKLEESLRATLRSTASITRRRLLENSIEQGCSMNVYYERLRYMVPSIPIGRRLSKVEILQYVIDYIQDLQNALEANAALRSSLSSTSRANRRPLTSLSLNKPDKV